MQHPASNIHNNYILINTFCAFRIFLVRNILLLFFFRPMRIARLTCKTAFKHSLHKHVVHTPILCCDTPLFFHDENKSISIEFRSKRANAIIKESTLFIEFLMPLEFCVVTACVWFYFLSRSELII